MGYIYVFFQMEKRNIAHRLAHLVVNCAMT
jgi:hypothetical protein